MAFQTVPKRRIIRWGLLVLVLAGFMISLTPQRLAAAAPSVTFIGADTTTNDAWRTTSVAKPLDIDGDNIYGSDGFYLYSGGTHTLTALPPYATVIPRPGMTVYSGNMNYISYDNPDLTGTGPVPDVITGVIYNTNNPTEWVDITFTQPGLFRVGIITDNADFIPISPLNFRFQQITGGTVDTGYIAASADRDRDIDYYLFDVEANAGDVYRLSGQNDPGHPSNGIAAIFFDGIPALTITDTTAGTATNDGTVNVSEYVGFSTGINNGFGNVIGSASRLHIDSDGSGNLNLGLEAGATVVLPNAMVVYIDTDNGTTGFTTTGGFTDTGDGCRRAISGYDGGNRSTLNFAPGFAANYAICLDGSFAGLWQLANGGSHPFVTSLNRSNSGIEYEMNFTLANLGLNVGDSFRYVATYLNHDNAFRSNEFHGVAIFAGGNPGYTTVNLTSHSFIVFEAVDTTLVVDRADDTNAAAAQVCDDALPTDCSLRGAISKANADTTGGYTILFAPSLNGTPITLSIAGRLENNNATGDLDITDSLTINGNGARTTIIDANDVDRVLDVQANTTVVINDLTIQNGNANQAVNDGSPGTTGEDGGGIRVNGGSISMTLNRVRVTSNEANDEGGGVALNTDGTTVTINQSLIDGNQAVVSGDATSGAVGLFPGGTAIINNSTLSGNTARYGGAIQTQGGTATLNYTTVTGNNFAGGDTAGLRAQSAVTLNGSIVSGNGTSDCSLGGVVSSGYNVVGSGGSANGCPSGGTGDLILAGATGTLLNTTLADNGGSTNTHALVNGGVAVNQIPNGTNGCGTTYTTDQRGVTRPQNGTCDVGAYELVTAVTPGVNGGDGPGGVGTTNGSSNLEVWLRADKITGLTDGATIATWSDLSGNAQNATQGTPANQPTYQTGEFNTLPVVRFDINDFLISTPDLTSTVTILYAIKQNLTAAFPNPWNFSTGGYVHTPYNGGVGYIESYWSLRPLVRSNPFVTTGVAHILTWMEDGTQATLHNGSILRATYTGGSAPNWSGAQMRIGGVPSVNSSINGDIADAIVYNTPLNSVERILVENYLSAKYTIDISASGNDHYDGDTVGNGDFDLDVAGIGQFGGNQHTQAHSAGMIVVNDTFLNENGDWLLFGHRTVNNSNSTADLPTGGDWGGVNDVRWARHWTVDVTDPSVNNGRVDIIFDFSEAGMNGGLPPSTPANYYRLLKRTGTTGPFSDITALSGATVIVAGDQVQFLGVDVAQLGSNFTLGSLDGVTSPTAITTQNVASQISQPTYLALILLLLVLLAITIKVVWRRIV